MTPGVRYHRAVRVRGLLFVGVIGLIVGCKSKSAAPPTQERPQDDKSGSVAGSAAGSAVGAMGSDHETRGGSAGGGDDTRPIEHGGRPVTADVGQVVAVGSLDQSLIRREIKKRLADVNKCYEQAVASKPTLAGAIVAQFTIEPDGKVSAAKSSGLDDELGRCVARVIEQITFPRPKNGGKVSVSYPFQFRLAAAGSSTP